MPEQHHHNSSLRFSRSFSAAALQYLFLQSKAVVIVLLLGGHSFLEMRILGPHLDRVMNFLLAESRPRCRELASLARWHNLERHLSDSQS